MVTPFRRQRKLVFQTGLFVINAELFQVRTVLLRIEVIFLHLWAHLRHQIRIEVDGRLVIRAEQWRIFLGLELHVLLPTPCAHWLMRKTA